MRWGILSTGTIASKFAKTLLDMHDPQETAAAVASRTIEKAVAFADTYHIPIAHSAYEALADDPQVEAVYVATPNNFHYEHVRMCLNAGKHVLCEKPLTTCAEDARELYALAQQKGLFLMEAFWIRFLPLYEKLLSLIDSGTLGALQHARCDYGFIAQGPRRTRKFRSELGGGALLDIGIYNLGFLRMVMGSDPEAFTSEVQFNEFGTDCFSVLQLTYPGGRTAHSLQAIGLEIPRHAALYFEKGNVYLPDFQDAFKMEVHPLGQEAYTLSFPPEVNGFEYEIREATRCIQAKETCSSIFTPEDSIATLQLMDQIRRQWGMKFSFE